MSASLPALPPPQVSKRTHPLRNALQLDPICQVWIHEAVTNRRARQRGAMRINAHMAIYRARIVWRRYVDLPPAA